ncbi:MAG: hypothetical protein NTY66_00945 [Candidatus Vogelbacteria bacterium]|nr:hypothetical protein [Candidatus Vogelbacteria bacterium]
MKVCTNPNCSFANNGGNFITDSLAKFCPDCGQPVKEYVAPILQCPCGHLLGADDAFCTRCRKPRSEAKEITLEAAFMAMEARK